MKATGIVRRIDDIGRIVIPKGIRTQLGLDEGTPMELFIDKGKIVFEKYHPGGTSDILGELENELSIIKKFLAPGTEQQIQSHIDAIKELLKE